MKRIFFFSLSGIAFFFLGFFGWDFLLGALPQESAIVSAPDSFLAVREESGEAREVVMLFVGDIMLSRGIEYYMKKKNDWVYPFRSVGDIIQSADIAVGNLEGPISDKGARAGSIYSFRADPRAVEGLAFAGFDVLSVANNHIWDYGSEAFLDTLRILNENGILYAGGGRDYAEAHAPAMKETNGITFAFLSYTDLVPVSVATEASSPAVAFAQKEIIIRDIESAKERADIVVALFHWGVEYAPRHNALQEDLAHAAIDAGAKLIIGHHPHVVQDTEEYGGGFIAYSLGNFIFDQNFSKETSRGLMLRAVARGSAIESIEELPVSFTHEFETVLEHTTPRSDF